MNQNNNFFKMILVLMATPFALFTCPDIFKRIGENKKTLFFSHYGSMQPNFLWKSIALIKVLLDQSTFFYA